MRAKSRITPTQCYLLPVSNGASGFRSRGNPPLEDGRPESIGWSVWIDWQSSRRGLIPGGTTCLQQGGNMAVRHDIDTLPAAVLAALFGLLTTPLAWSQSAPDRTAATAATPARLPRSWSRHSIGPSLCTNSNRHYPR